MRILSAHIWGRVIEIGGIRGRAGGVAAAEVVSFILSSGALINLWTPLFYRIVAFPEEFSRCNRCNEYTIPGCYRPYLYSLAYYPEPNKSH